MKSRTPWLALLVMLAIIALWAIAVPLAQQLPRDAFNEPFGSVYNGLNVLFTALAFGGVIVTLLFQADEARHARREEIERSIFELFQTFTTPEFQAVKNGAFRALLAAVKDAEYAEYLASKLFAVEQARFPDSVIPALRELDEEKQTLDAVQIEHADRTDRLMLDNMLNFFALLAQRQTSATVIKHCDFAYDWWRPTLWLIACHQQARYERLENIRTYCRTPLISRTLQSLDRIYGHPPLRTLEQTRAYVDQHPRIQAFRQPRTPDNA